MSKDVIVDPAWLEDIRLVLTLFRADPHGRRLMQTDARVAALVNTIRASCEAALDGREKELEMLRELLRAKNQPEVVRPSGGRRLGHD